MLLIDKIEVIDCLVDKQCELDSWGETDKAEEVANVRLSIDQLNTITIPDKATNGDIIKTVFPDVKIDINENLGVYGTVFIDFKDEIITMSLEWWNGLYNGVKNEQNTVKTGQP